MLMDDKRTRHLRAPLFKASSEDAQREVLLAAAADLALGCALTTFESETIPCVAAQYGDERAARVIRPVRGRVEARGFACDADDVARDGDEAAIVLVRRGGGCGFAQKAANAQRAGYAAVLTADRPPPESTEQLNVARTARPWRGARPQPADRDDCARERGDATLIRLARRVRARAGHRARRALGGRGRAELVRRDPVRRDVQATKHRNVKAKEL